MEPWLRGPLADIPPHLMPVFFSFQQVREDLANYTQAITRHQLWLQIAGKHSLGYHLKHIAGSVDRLVSYLAGQPLSDEQLEFLHNEHVADGEVATLLAFIDERLRDSEQQLLQLKADDLFAPRFVGRDQLPTTVIGLIVHVCEHTQRHLGQAILITRLLHQG